MISVLELKSKFLFNILVCVIKKTRSYFNIVLKKSKFSTGCHLTSEAATVQDVPDLQIRNLPVLKFTETVVS